MSRLRNRITKATFWTDGELLRWPRDKRFFYKSLWSMAEDSCCVEDDPFGWKCCAWVSPLDADITVEKLTEWRDELIHAGKCIRYSSGGKDYLYLPEMAKHETPRNPQSPDIPLPSWVKWEKHASDQRKGSYKHQLADLTDCTTVETTNLTVPALPCPDLSCPELPCTDGDESVQSLSFFPACLDAVWDNQDKMSKLIKLGVEDQFGAKHLAAESLGKLGAAIKQGCPDDCPGSQSCAEWCFQFIDHESLEMGDKRRAEGKDTFNLWLYRIKNREVP